MLPATTTAQELVRANNGCRVPQTRTARNTHTQSPHGRRCQAIPNPEKAANQDAARPPPRSAAPARKWANWGCRPSRPHKATERGARERGGRDNDGRAEREQEVQKYPLHRGGAWTGARQSTGQALERGQAKEREAEQEQQRNNQKNDAGRATAAPRQKRKGRRATTAQAIKRGGRDTPRTEKVGRSERQLGEQRSPKKKPTTKDKRGETPWTGSSGEEQAGGDTNPETGSSGEK